VLDEMQPILVQIPPGIWHGFQNIGNIDAVLLHMNTVPFDAENMDEEKLSIQNAIIPYIW
jgi:dTDP-4-dehydrorhamnose 3,5-epimerase